MMLKLSVTGATHRDCAPLSVRLSVNQDDLAAVKVLRDFIRKFMGKDIWLIPLEADSPHTVEADTVGDFVAECCQPVSDDGSCTIQEIYDAFCHWCVSKSIALPKGMYCSIKSLNARLYRKGCCGRIALKPEWQAGGDAA